MTRKGWTRRISIFLLLGTLSADSSVFGQHHTNGEELREKRLAKIQQVRSYRQPLFEKIFVMLEKNGGATPEKRRKFILEKTPLWPERAQFKEAKVIDLKGFFPVVGGIGTGSGIAAGLRFKHIHIGNSPLGISSTAALSNRGYQFYDLQFGALPLRERRSFAYLDLRFRNLPQEDFFGLGPDSRRQDRTDFLLKDRFYGGVIGYEFTSWLRAAFRGGLLQVNLGPGSDDRFLDTEQVFSRSAVPGLARQPDFLELNSVLFVDYRDKPGNPHKGGVIGLSFSRFDDRGGEEFEFNRYAFEARHYLPLGADQRVLALRVYSSVDEPSRGSRVPFYLQETLGGGTLLRGFESYRFRDTRLLYGSAEYRWEAIPALEFALLYDVGKVFSERSDFDLEGLRKSFGGGVRIKTSDAVLFRLDVGRSNEGLRFNLRFGPSF